MLFSVLHTYICFSRINLWFFLNLFVIFEQQLNQQAQSLMNHIEYSHLQLQLFVICIYLQLFVSSPSNDCMVLQYDYLLILQVYRIYIVQNASELKSSYLQLYHRTFVCQHLVYPQQQQCQIIQTFGNAQIQKKSLKIKTLQNQSKQEKIHKLFTSFKQSQFRFQLLALADNIIKFKKLIHIQLLRTMQVGFEINDKDLAEQLKRLKLQNQKKHLEIERIKASDPQIQAIKKKIQASYVSKQRSHQIVQKQFRDLQEKSEEALNQAMVIQRAREEQQKIKRRHIQLLQKERQNQYMLANQMQDRKKLQLEAHQQYLKEKDQVDQDVQKMIQIQLMERKKREQQKLYLYQEMQNQFVVKEQLRQQRQIQAKQQLRIIDEYLQKMDQKGLKSKQEKIQKQKQRDKIYLQLKVADEKRKKQQEQIQEMRMDYYQLRNQFRDDQRQKEEKQKRQMFKVMLKNADIEQRQMKKKQMQEEKYLEEGFRKKMLERLAEQERVEQLTLERRRAKVRQHQKQVQRLWGIKLEQYRQVREQQQRQVQAKRLAEMWKIKIVEAEKEKLIRENAVYLGGFLHPDLIPRAKQMAVYNQHPEDTRYFDNYKIQ